MKYIIVILVLFSFSCGTGFHAINNNTGSSLTVDGLTIPDGVKAYVSDEGISDLKEDYTTRYVGSTLMVEQFTILEVICYIPD